MSHGYERDYSDDDEEPVPLARPLRHCRGTNAEFRRRPHPLKARQSFGPEDYIISRREEDVSPGRKLKRPEDVLAAKPALHTPELASDGSTINRNRNFDLDPMSTCAESIFSQQSARTSVTDVPSTCYDTAEKVTATKVLVDIFTEDSGFSHLYTRAIEDQLIGPDRLKRNLYGLLKSYAQNLHGEAQMELQRLASQLVAAKARDVAQCIMEKFHVQPTIQKHQEVIGPRAENSDEENVEDDEVPSVDEDRLEDIAVFRQFLVGSAAFSLFAEHSRSFVQPKVPKMPDEPSLGSSEKERMDGVVDQPDLLLPQALLVAERISQQSKQPQMTSLKLRSSTWNSLLVACGFLEPPLSVGTVRIRWSCVSPETLAFKITGFKY